MIPNRKDVRKAVKASMDLTLVGPSKVAQYCYDYQTGEFDQLVDGQAANVAVYVVNSTGADRMQEVAGEPALVPEQSIFLSVHSFVLYEKMDENGTVEWTESQSEDKIDDMEHEFMSWVEANMDRRAESNPPWLMCVMTDKSEIDSAFLSGIEYRHEEFKLQFIVANPS